MLRKKTRPMTKEESEMFVMLCISENMPTKEDSDAPILFRILKKRLEWAGFDQCVSENVMLWCSYLAKGNPGKTVMWAWQVAYLSKNIYDSPISMTQWTDQFPSGVPTDEFYEVTWDLQKDGGANLLDNVKYWPGHEKGDYLMRKWGMETKGD